jgi:polysaccharide pyruvyl transferase WcaK-like protein
MHVVVTNMANDGNRGDLAILSGTISALRAAEPGIGISIAPAEVGSRERLDGAAMADSTALADGPLIASPVPGRVDEGGPALLWTYRTARALVSQALGLRWIEGAVDADFREAIGDADLVIAKGGSYLFSYPGLKQALFAARMVHSLRVARSVGTPSVVLGTSLGPVQRPLRRYFQSTLGSCRAVITREDLSFAFAREQLHLSNVQHGVDMAFALYPGAQSERSRAGIAITPRDLPFEPPEARLRYESAVVDAVELLLAETDQRCYFAVQVDRDRDLCERLARRVGNAERVEVAHVDSLSLPELIDWYGRRELLIATRLHSVILAALMHTPSVILECDPPKMIGISEQLGLADWRLRAGLDEVRGLPRLALSCFHGRDLKRDSFATRMQELATASRLQASRALDFVR